MKLNPPPTCKFDFLIVLYCIVYIFLVYLVMAFGEQNCRVQPTDTSFHSCWKCKNIKDAMTRLGVKIRQQMMYNLIVGILIVHIVLRPLKTDNGGPWVDWLYFYHLFTVRSLIHESLCKVKNSVLLRREENQLKKNSISLKNYKLPIQNPVLHLLSLWWLTPRQGFVQFLFPPNLT